MLNRSQKEALVADLAGRFQKQRVSIFADIRGISVAKLSSFRRELQNVGAEFKIARKTLFRRALEIAGIGIEPKHLDGELGVIFGYEDQAAPAKLAAKFAKSNETFRILKGLLGASVLEGTDILTLAKLPPREQLLAKLASALEGPIRGLATVLQGNIRGLVIALNQVKSNRN